MRLPPHTVSAGAKPVRRKAHLCISAEEAENLSEGLNFARSIALEPNLFVTLQWALAPSDQPIPDRIQQTINRAWAWLRRRKVKFAWAYVREPGTKKGEHLHWLVFVPKRFHATFEQVLRGWMDLDAHGKAKRGAVDVRRIKGTLHTFLKRYLMKNGTDEVRNRMWMPAGAKYRRTEGVTMGRRVRLSRSIDKAPRRYAGWQVGRR